MNDTNTQNLNLITQVIENNGFNVRDVWAEDSQTSGDEYYLHVVYDRHFGIETDITCTPTGKCKIIRRSKRHGSYDRLSTDSVASKDINTIEGREALKKDMNEIASNQDIRWERKKV